MAQVKLFTDGACKNNPGPGGWAFVLIWGDVLRRAAGGEPHTTNNRMELRAVIEGLRALTRPCAVEVTTDSQYVKKAFTAGWLDTWMKNGWKTRSGPVKNQDLWIELVGLRRIHNLSWQWVRGHSGHRWNELCDEMASDACTSQRRQDFRETLAQ